METAPPRMRTAALLMMPSFCCSSLLSDPINKHAACLMPITRTIAALLYTFKPQGIDVNALFQQWKSKQNTSAFKKKSSSLSITLL